MAKKQMYIFYSIYLATLIGTGAWYYKSNLELNRELTASRLEAQSYQQQLAICRLKASPNDPPQPMDEDTE